MHKKPLILITNDDSYRAKGIKELVEYIKDLGKIVVVAPKNPMSAKSHSITVTEPLWIKKLSSENDITWYYLNGTPADCIKFALHQLLEEKPDLILSGINHGPNYSVSQFYSGTVAGAIEGTLNGVPSIAFSLNDFDSEADFSKSKDYIRKITKEVLANPLPTNICLNVNFPDFKTKHKGLKICRQTHGKWVEKFIEQTHPWAGNYYWLSGTFTNFEPDAGDNDVWAVENGYASVLPLNIDMTDYNYIEKIKSW
ncbi:MAG: 5'/3'-nucleotidase SurE, partial [Bacteroidales bacterium]|nr:5'/3'-nucleotidase SurE [Bacteroidales bacterium]